MPVVSHVVSAFGAVLVISGALAGCKLYNPALLGNVSVSDAGVVQLPVQPMAAVVTTGCAPDACTILVDAGARAPKMQDEGGRGIELVDGMDAGVDACPRDESKTSPGICGCGNGELDSDLDGTRDCVDGCPQDAAKTAPGACGCGMPDVDSDADGTGDCIDLCPHDASKTTTGVCGCGVPEDDRDGDGTADCLDSCPDDATKTNPGACGCANQDPMNPSAGAIYCAKSALRHRYSFESTTQIALDSVGSADALIVDAVQQAGSLVLAGDQGVGVQGEGYAVVPISVWSDLTSATIEAWFIWHGVGVAGTDEWQRIFDVGRQQGDSMARYWFLSPLGGGGVRTAFSLGGPIDQEVSVTTPQPARLDAVQHVACVVDAATGTLSLFYDGMLQGPARLPGTLSDLAPDSLWLGRSHFEADPAFHGEILEFRIYDAALSSAQLQASATAGPDYDFAP